MFYKYVSGVDASVTDVANVVLPVADAHYNVVPVVYKYCPDVPKDANAYDAAKNVDGLLI